MKHYFLKGMYVCLLALALLGAGCKPGTPKAAFTADKTSGTAPLTVQFTDQSTLEKLLPLPVDNTKLNLVAPGMPKASVIQSWS